MIALNIVKQSAPQNIIETTDFISRKLFHLNKNRFSLKDRSAYSKQCDMYLPEQRKKITVTVYLSSTEDGLLECLSEFDRQVFSACLTLHENNLGYVTPQLIAKLLKGQPDAPSVFDRHSSQRSATSNRRTFKEKILVSLHRLMSTRIAFSVEELSRFSKYQVSDSYEGLLVPMTTTNTVSVNGTVENVLQFGTTPTLYTFAKDLGHFVTYDVTLRDTGHKGSTSLELSNFLLSEIAYSRGTTFKLLWATLYSIFTLSDRRLKLAFRKKISLLLDFFVGRKILTSYTIDATAIIIHSQKLPAYNDSDDIT